MKNLLPILLCYLLMTTQAYALKGGPVYGGSGGISPIGVYSGTLLGSVETLYNTNGTVAGTVASNSIGLFTLGVPSPGAASGSFLLFSDGRLFTGTIAASIDPDTDELIGIVDGTYTFNLITVSAGVSVSNSVTAVAAGGVTATISATIPGDSDSAILYGSADMEISGGKVYNTGEPVIASEISFTVNGFRQSTSVTTAGTFTTTTTSSGG